MESTFVHMIIDSKKLALLGGLDIAHAEMVHDRIVSDYMPMGVLGKQEMEAKTAYRECCRLFFMKGDGSQLPLMNRYACMLLTAWAETAESNAADEDIARIARKTVRTFSGTKEAEIRLAWNTARKEGGMEAMCRRLDSQLKAIADELKAMPEQAGTTEAREKGYEDVAANLYCLIECLAKTKEQHPVWFEGMLEGGSTDDIVLLTDSAVCLYCHLRQKEDLPTELAEDMDIHLRIFNQKTEFFGDWSLSVYADMLLGSGMQSEDYSDIEGCQVWKTFEESI
jgi:hypothetical protein